MTLLLILPLAFGLSFALTAALRRYALQRSLIDVPNARSSHTVPTPRGGGVAIVIAVAVLLSALAYTGHVGKALVWALLGAGLSVALIGFADDHGHIAARWRLLGHFMAALWALFWMGGLPAVSIFGITLELGWLGHVLALLFIVWVLNLYNFMDGIDGIASVEAICACLGALLCYAVAQPPQGFIMQGYPEWVVLASVVGFACWNFPRARIFMGDAGSGFLGIVVALLALDAAWAAPQLLWSWLILLGVFIVDATFTLFRRLLRGEAIFKAHRSHAYQIASRLLNGHIPVTLSVAMINLIWLLPLSVWVAYGGVDGASVTVLAYLPLLGLAIWLGAGKPEGAG